MKEPAPANPRIARMQNDWRLVRARSVEDIPNVLEQRFSPDQFVVTTKGEELAKKRIGLLQGVGDQLKQAYQLFDDIRKDRLRKLDEMGWLHIGAGTMHDVFKVTVADTDIAVRILRSAGFKEDNFLLGNIQLASLLELMEKKYQYDVVAVYGATPDFLVMEYVVAQTADEYAKAHPELSSAILESARQAELDYKALLSEFDLPLGPDIKPNGEGTNAFVMPDSSPRGFHLKLFDIGYGPGAERGFPLNSNEPIIHPKLA